MQTITPYLLCEDVAAQLDFLHRAFGFDETLRMAAEDGTVNHAEMRRGEGVINLGAPGGDFRNPAHSGTASVLICVTVDDVDAVCERARNAGAQITEEPADQDYGERRFAATDPEGHQWFVAQPIRDVAPEEWGATATG